jgi:hypothetical protein
MSNLQRSMYVLPNLNFSGMQPAIASNTTVTIQPGQCRDDQNISDLIILETDADLDAEGYETGPITIDVTVNGANGLDTGTVAASTLYAVWVIGSSIQIKPTAGLLSTSNTTPVMPEGYDVKRLRFYARTDGSSHFLTATCVGSESPFTYIYDTPLATSITAGNATSFTNVSLLNLVPLTDNSLAIVEARITPATAGNAVTMTAGNSTANQNAVKGQGNSIVVEQTFEQLVNTVTSAPTIKYKVSNSSDAAALNVKGFKFSV